jgi:hypothetical protein
MMEWSNSPMSNGLPDDTDGSNSLEQEEEALQDDGQVLKVVSVDVYSSDVADHSAGCHYDQPVPLPSSTDYAVSPIFSEELLAMLLEVDQSKEEANAKQRGKNEVQPAASFHAEDGHIAVGSIDEAAIGEEGRLVRVEDEVAIGIVGQGIIAVQSVVPVIQSGLVEVYSADNGVRGIVAAGEHEQIAQVEKRHVADVRKALRPNQRLNGLNGT